MAKILVADDNSNVQKTVALALADLGVEVVAVNNGDAAVRKLGDVMPDLVLADIFMPVRNGYEVCDFVKKDSRFSHVPVVLLVGAFDPLDEREAQRVAADGILKKPFVPPDPLIAMVKTLLERSLGERLVTVGAPQPAAAQNNAAGTTSAVKERPAAPPPPPAAPLAPEPVQEMAPEEEFHPPVDRLSFGEGEHPVAFGQLLDAPAKESADTETEAIEPVDDQQVLTSARDANLGEPIFWKAEEPETEEGEAETEEADDSEFASHAWAVDEETSPDSPHTEMAQAAETIEPFDLVRDEDAADAAPTIVEPLSSFAQDAASQASLTVESGKAPDLAANPLEWMATAPTPPAEEFPEEEEIPWSAAETDVAEHVEVGEEPAEELQAAPEPLQLPPPPVPARPAAAPPVGVMAPASFLGMSVPGSTPPAAPPTPPQSKIPAPTADPVKAQPPFKSLKQSAEDTARSIPKQEWADLAASLQAKPAAPPVEKPKATPPAPPAPAATAAAPEDSSFTSEAAAHVDVASPDPALVEAVVQRVLDKMRPQVVDIITKEFLRPVVQALVHREINKH